MDTLQGRPSASPELPAVLSGMLQAAAAPPSGGGGVAVGASTVGVGCLAGGGGVSLRCFFSCAFFVISGGKELLEKLSRGINGLCFSRCVV